MTNPPSKIKKDIDKHGLHIIHVMAEEEQPNFSYSIGLFETYQKPEIIIIGQSQDLLQILINNIAFDYKNGRELKSGELEADILDDHKCFVLDVEKNHFDEYLGLAIDYYQGNDFPVLQIIWPTPSNMFPFDKEAPEGFKKWQPLLGKVKGK